MFSSFSSDMNRPPPNTCATMIKIIPIVADPAPLSADESSGSGYMIGLAPTKATPPTTSHSAVQ